MQGTLPPELEAFLKSPAAYDAALSVEQKRRELDTQSKQIQNFRFDPYGFVMWAWPWGDPNGQLAHRTGPDENQKAFLIDLGKECERRDFNGFDPVEPVRMSISSGHGTGKSTEGAFVAIWILLTRPFSIGTVTAGTFQQLEERTWADIMHWGRMCRGMEDFDIQASGIFHKNPAYRSKWKITPKTSTQDKAQTFAGQHAATSTSWFLLDEASLVPDNVFKVAYGGLTDGEPMFFAWGQMERNTGEFYNICYGEASKRWNSRVFDGRKSGFTNKSLIEEWREEYGEDSDFFRVRVEGLPPRASELQFIGQDLVDGARGRDHTPLEDEPLVWGYDAANGGLAKHALWARRGLDAKSIPPIFLPGDTPRDVVVAKICELMGDQRPERRATALFGDQAFGAVVLQRVKESGYTNVFEVNFGDTKTLDPKCGNMRSYMWSQMKLWMEMGALPDEPKLLQPFMDPGFKNRGGKLYLESKEDMARRGVKSPDGPDALCLTFARKVANAAVVQRRREMKTNPWQ